MTDELLTSEQIRERDRLAIEDVRERLLTEYPGALDVLREHDFVICPRADYHPWERQSREAAILSAPSVFALLVLAERLGVQPSYLLGETE